MAGKNSREIRVAGTGSFWRAPLGTALPVDAAAAWPAGFVDLGYADDGYDEVQNLKRKEVRGWQSPEILRLLTLSLDRSFKFNLKQTNKDTLALALGGAGITPTPGVSAGTVAVAITTGVLTVSAAHSLSVGDMVQLGTMTGGAPLVAGTTYFVASIPTGTTLTVAATLGGVSIATTTSGTSTSITKVTGSYALVRPDANVILDFIIGFDWNDGTVVERSIIQRAAYLSLPTIKRGKQDAIAYDIEIGALVPYDGTKSVLTYGVDIAVGS